MYALSGGPRARQYGSTTTTIRPRRRTCFASLEETALDGIAARVDDHGAMLRVRSPIRRGRWLLSGVFLLPVAIRAIFATRGGAQEAPRPFPLLISIDGLCPDHIIGPGVPAGRSLGVIDMRDVAPTLARRLGLTLPTAKTLLP